MKIQDSQFLSTLQLQEQYLNQTRKLETAVTKEGLSFEDILKYKTGQSARTVDLKFSKHAANRLADRDITLTDNQLERLNQGTHKAMEKGINESLVIVDQLAFIVNIPSSTVITAMDQRQTNDKIFTNIDGAVIM